MGHVIAKVQVRMDVRWSLTWLSSISSWVSWLLPHLCLVLVLRLVSLMLANFCIKFWTLSHAERKGCSVKSLKKCPKLCSTSTTPELLFVSGMDHPGLPWDCNCSQSFPQPILGCSLCKAGGGDWSPRRQVHGYRLIYIFSKLRLHTMANIIFLLSETNIQ